MTGQLRLLIVFVICTLIADAWISYSSIHALVVQENNISASYRRLQTLEAALSSVTDAERNQRGYLLTGDEEYLAPYEDAAAEVDSQLTALRNVWPQDAAGDVDALARLVRSRQHELQQALELRRSGTLSPAKLTARGERGKVQMDGILAVVGRLRTGEERRLAAATAASAVARGTVFRTVVFSTGIALALIAVWVVMVRRDLARRARLAEERAFLLSREREARSEAERANKLKDDFLATLSHELRNPLHAVVGWLHILRQQPHDPELRSRAIETVDRNARALHRMIEDLLDASRTTRGKLDLKLSPTSLGSLVESVLETLRPSAASHGITLQQQITEQNTAVIGDYDRLAQVVINLVSNAIKFTPEGGRVDVRLTSTDWEALLSVSDTGRGISAESIPHIFEAFRQSGPRMTGSEGGLGLGLSIAKHIVALHGGTIQAESEGEGRGARFSVRLPLAGAGRAFAGASTTAEMSSGMSG